jgi:hypothetical protein
MAWGSSISGKLKELLPDFLYEVDKTNQCCDTYMQRVFMS